MLKEFRQAVPIAHQLGFAFNFSEFIDRVETNGVWDFKNRTEYQNIPWIEEAGNFTFGALGAAWIDGNVLPVTVDQARQILQRGAGAYQEYYQPNEYDSKNGSFYSMNPPYGDNPRDGANISRGLDFYVKNRKELIK